MRLRSSGPFRFDRLLPIQNWYYPLAVRPLRIDAARHLPSVYATLERDYEKPLALYFHVPFCETICSFCPFVRSTRRENDLIGDYFNALVGEIALKATIESVAARQVGAIFVGGGTPSLLSPDQIVELGEIIRRTFKLAPDLEFSFELEAKSVTDDRLAALREAGVTHVRMGAQTFNPTYRRAFNLTATLNQVSDALRLMTAHFANVSFDILYGMDGQSLEAFEEDVRNALATSVPLIDFYPINNTITQPKLHSRYRQFGLAATPAPLKLEMNRRLRRLMAAAGYSPHNGHGYVRLPKPLPDGLAVSDAYSFRYHEFVYGYGGMDILGFGTNAISTARSFTLQNTANRADYIQSISRREYPPVVASACDKMSAESKSIIFRVPYHGRADKSKIDFFSVYPETLERMAELIEAGLLKDTGAEIQLTEEGWHWYVNLMYYMLPPSEQLIIDNEISIARTKDPNRLNTVEMLLPD